MISILFKFYDYSVTAASSRSYGSRTLWPQDTSTPSLSRITAFTGGAVFIAIVLGPNCPDFCSIWCRNATGAELSRPKCLVTAVYGDLSYEPPIVSAIMTTSCWHAVGLLSRTVADTIYPAIMHAFVYAYISVLYCIYGIGIE